MVVTTGGYLPFLPFLSGFAFLSLATLVSFEQVDAAQARASVGHPWPLATGGSVAVGVGNRDSITPRRRGIRG